METKVVINPPQQVMAMQNSREWGSGICGCFTDMRDCCLAFWCLPCFACLTSRAYGEHLCTPLLECFAYMISPITMSMRTSMRERYNIEGSIARDCIFVTFCLPCVWCQMSREIKRRNLQVVMVGAKNI
ncbi:PREDICTED: cornifelin homolog B-like [Cyprinodon variegatus]|uniref:Cornifelin homolog B-like n=1 Tax=Cyprinodon variegatus TaxID=28743 RepID=A0A3Q2FE61_CYPVA|nr:PREDICTED: cornifelin homolog B-like [Cyprinodon variegatus]